MTETAACDPAVGSGRVRGGGGGIAASSMQRTVVRPPGVVLPSERQTRIAAQSTAWLFWALTNAASIERAILAPSVCAGEQALPCVIIRRLRASDLPSQASGRRRPGRARLTVRVGLAGDRSCPSVRRRRFAVHAAGAQTQSPRDGAALWSIPELGCQIPFTTSECIA